MTFIKSGYRLEYKLAGSSEPCDLTCGIFANKKDAHKHARGVVVKRGYLIYNLIGVGTKDGHREAWTNSKLQRAIRMDRFQTKVWKLLWSNNEYSNCVDKGE